MPGRIMSAQQAKETYGTKYKSIRKVGNTVVLNNSNGKEMTVGKNARVYHRGRGKFAAYSTSRDAQKVSRGATTLGGKGAVGSGSYRHTSDYKKK